MSVNGLVTCLSESTWNVTRDRLLAAIKSAGIPLLAHINHSDDAEHVGLELLPSEVFIFGNPKVGTPLMQAAPSIALDLPLKMLLLEDASGAVSVSYYETQWLANRHGLTSHADVLQKINDLMKSLAETAIKQP